MSAFTSNTDFSFLLRDGRTTARPATGLFGGIGRALSTTLSRLAAIRQRRTMMAELFALTDHELADIGIARADIPRVFDAGFVAKAETMRRAGGVSGRAATL